MAYQSEVIQYFDKNAYMITGKEKLPLGGKLILFYSSKYFFHTVNIELQAQQGIE